MMKMYERIRTAIEQTPGLTQKGLAERMGVNAAAVNRLLHGRRNIMADEVPIIETYIGKRLMDDMDYAQVGVASSARASGFSDTPPAPFYHGDALGAAERSLPVYKPDQIAQAEDTSALEPVDWTPRPANLFGVRDAFALYVFSTDMSPRYEMGEIVYVHTGRPPESGRDCLLKLKNGTVAIRKFLGTAEQGLRFALYQPAQETIIPQQDVAGLYLIAGRG